ncbi:hypothetical protein [Solirubrobacter soli]|uniref:hypothetical protein n=1 Tax=Solirubrobacter soli TaxID=363832 RepID=UPI000428E5AE|nr:hypothetical protein [Solirubrobacter soli]
MLETKLVFGLGDDADPNRRGAPQRWIVQAVEDPLRRLGTYPASLIVDGSRPSPGASAHRRR